MKMQASVNLQYLILLPPRACAYASKNNPKFPVFLSSSQKQLTRLHISCRGTIEDNGYGMLQVRNPLISMVHSQKPLSALFNAE